MSKFVRVMDSYGNMWILNIISLKDNTSYILYSNDKVKNKLLVKKPAMLRKEIMKLVNINNKSD
ncbi:MAG: hypothetical protein GX951_05575 [Mollicutes bacterium]|nr:hypothetical protein [Mollicutes bacterium]